MTSVFFTITPLVLGTSLFSLVVLTKTQPINNQVLAKEESIKFSKSGVKVYASLPGTIPKISGEISVSDARTEIIRQYLAEYNSPLEAFASQIVTASDRYNIDFRLTTAIAHKESGLCKKIPFNSYNCWGWGIHSKGVLGFESFEEGIEVVTKGLRENYVDEGYVGLEEIMSKYTPLSNGSWAEGVRKFMDRMQ